MARFESHQVLKTIWTIVAIISAVPILLEVVGIAAWNGVNFALVVYLFVSSAGVLALIASLCSPWLHSAVFQWITWFGAIGIAGLGLVFAAGFAFGLPGINAARHYNRSCANGRRRREAHPAKT